MKKYLVLLLFLSACTHGAIHFEDDYLNPFNHNADKFYTAGEQVDYIEGNKTYSLGNLIYTPSHKHADATPEQLKNDRPYSGYTYLQYREDALEATWKTSYGISAGCVGPCSFSKQIQQTVHGLLQQPKPAWIKSAELKSEPGFILEYEKRKLLYGTDHFDSVVYGLGKFGNIIDSGSIGTTIRSGYNIGSPFQGVSPIVFKASPDEHPWRAYAFATAEERGVAYNQLLDGSLFRSEPHTVSSVPFVTEIDAGVSIGYGIYTLSYIWTRFSKEWKNGPSNFCFAGINLEW